MGFEAELTNPKPRGTIKTTGSFGPWRTADRRVATLRRLPPGARDLATFKEIAGFSTRPALSGNAARLTVDGQADVPDFRLRTSECAALATRFMQSRRDNGDTAGAVDATLGAHIFRAGIDRARTGNGGCGSQQPGGHDIALTVNVDKGRIEDFLRLASTQTNSSSLVT